jgi:hypothetical protein
MGSPCDGTKVISVIRGGGPGSIPAFSFNKMRQLGLNKEDFKVSGGDR